MKIHDLSLPLSPNLPVWPGHPDIELERFKTIAAGGSSNVSRLALGVHSGTHVDAPIHFIDGAAAVETLPLDVLTGRALVISLPSISTITVAALVRARVPRR